MSFKTFSIIAYGLVFLGLSIGYLLGFYIHRYTMNSDFFYLSVIFMAIGSFMIIYGTLFKK